MKWAKEVPTQPGFYWCRGPSDDVDIVKLIADGEGKLYGLEFGCEHSFSALECYEWYGPLAPSEHP